MGSQVLAAVESSDPEAARLLAEVPRWFAGWEQTLSRFKEDSELSQLNASVAIGETEHRLLANALADVGEVEEAEALFRTGAEAGDANALVDLGALLQDESRMDEAETVLQLPVLGEIPRTRRGVAA